MKYLDMPIIIKLNYFFSKLNALKPGIGLELETYSCKQTKNQKRHINIKKPLRFYISALEESFSDYDFSNEKAESFIKVTYPYIKKELEYILFTVYKNYDSVNETINYINNILNYCISIKKSSFFMIKNLFPNEEEQYRIFIIHDKDRKRVIIIKYIINKV